jgi:hypothetical protein
VCEGFNIKWESSYYIVALSFQHIQCNIEEREEKYPLFSIII